ncbi:MAG: hypothetical protein ACYDBB_17475 [Armatimonadota bacterium]
MSIYTIPADAAKRLRWLPYISLLLLTMLGICLPEVAQADTLVQTFTLKELFNVTHQSQVVDFDLNQTLSSAYLLNDGGQEVPYQVLSGNRIAFVTDLPANTTKHYYLWEGRAPAPVNNGVVLDSNNPNYYQLTNGLTGIRIPKVYAPLTPTPKSPIQGVQFHDGTWSAAGTNLQTYLWTPSNAVTSTDGMTVTFKEQGPIKTVVEVHYAFTSPVAYYSSTVIRPAGAAHYTTTIEIQMGQPSIKFELDTDLESTSSLSLYNGVSANQLRYQGHHASDVAYGRNPNGTRYNASEVGANYDALVDINYGANVEVSSTTSATTRKWMAVWDPWSVNTGWYWQAYNTTADSSGNLAGIFAGPASRAIAAAASGVGIYNRTTPDMGISITTWLRGGDARLFYYLTPYHTIRYAWGLFMGAKGADLPADVTAVPTINKQMNIHAGLNLNKLMHMTLEYDDPTPPFGAMYIERAKLDSMISRCRSDNAYYTYLYNAETSTDTRRIVDMWRDTTGAKTHDCAAAVTTYASLLANDLSNGRGLYAYPHMYYMSGISISRYADAIDQALSNEYITSADKTTLKATAAFFANHLWDDDHAPMQAYAEGGYYTACLNMGPANMPVMQQGYRDSYAMLLSAHPTMAPHLSEIPARAHATLEGIVNAAGAEMGCPHYVAASFTPTHNLELQQRMLSLANQNWTDPFSVEPKLGLFGEFYTICV